MPDSLSVGEQIELLGPPGGVQSQIPALQNAAGVGAVYQLLAPPGGGGGSAVSYGMSYDLGAPQPTQDLVQSLLLDGERPFGYRASNREIHLPVKITAPDMNTMTAARELLMQAVDKQTWELTWTPASTGLPLVFDCFRALPATVTYGFLLNRMPIAVITLHFQALPYGRSDPSSGLQQVAFASPLLGGIAAPPAPVLLDNFGTVSGANWSQSALKYVTGPNSAHFTPPAAAWGSVCTYTRTGLPTLNLTGLPVLSVWTGLSYDTAHFGPWPAMNVNLTLAWTLTDNGGHTISFHRTYNRQRWSNSAANPAWTRHTANIPQGVAGFNYSGIAAYAVRISNWIYQGNTVLIRLHAWMDAVTANPPSLSQPASQRGVLYTIMGAQGTARTPFSAQFQLPQSGAVTTELTGSGVWWPPLGVTSVQAECVGAGGAGSNRTTAGQGGGGGGGEYAREPSLAVSAGTPVPYACGTGGSPGDVSHTVTFGTAGAGSWTVPAGVTSVKAECWGGGAGGGPGGGGGGGGEYAAEAALTVTPGTRVPFVAGAGGSGGGGLAAQGTVTSRSGGISTFGSAATTTTVVTAHGGVSALLGGTSPGNGGSGSANTTHFTGGIGGTSPNSGGGGGGGSAGTAAIGNPGGAGTATTGGAGASAVAGGGAGGAGSPVPGYPGAGSAPGGGGGGGFSTSYNGGGGNGAAGQVRLTYVTAGGSPVNGTATTFGSAGTTGTVVRANGGGSAAANSTANGTGAGGSTNSVHFAGGNGGLGGTAGGGGAGSGGSASVGNNGTAGASGGTGAAAVAGGGKGGNGATAADTPGQPAAPPGGGGGGSYMNVTAQSGGAGGGGAIWLTWTPPLQPFGTLIAHRPGPDAPENLNPCIPLTSTSDPPDNRQYPVPQVIAGVNSLYRGTYSVVLMNYVWDNPGASRQITLTVYQYEYAGGPGYSVQLIRTLTPATDITNGLVVMGELTLPVKDMDPSNTSAYYAFSVSDTDQADQFLDVLLLDTQGQTVIINIPPGNTYTNFFLDEPTSDRDLGRIMGSDLDRSQAISVLDSCIISGGPFYLNPGDNSLLAYTPSGAPNLGCSYLSRWFTDRIS